MKNIALLLSLIFITSITACKKELESTVAPVPAPTSIISAPVQLFPLNDTIPYLSAVLFKWTKISDAVKYKFTLSLDSNFNTHIIQFNTFDTSYTYSDVESIMNDKVYWKVQSIDKNNSVSKDSLYSSFQFPVYSNEKPSIFNTSLTYNIVDPDLFNEQFRFSKIKGAIAYEVLGSHYPDFIQPTSSNPEDNIARTNFTDSTSTLSYKINTKNLIWNDTTYLKIRAILPNNEYSNWSDVITLIVLDDRDPLIGNYMLKHLDFIPRVVDSEMVQLTKVGRNGLFINAVKAAATLDYSKFDDNYTDQSLYWSFVHPNKSRHLKFENKNGKITFSGYYKVTNGNLSIIGEKR